MVTEDDIRERNHTHALFQSKSSRRPDLVVVSIEFPTIV